MRVDHPATAENMFGFALSERPLSIARRSSTVPASGPSEPRTETVGDIEEDFNLGGRGGGAAPKECGRSVRGR